MGDGVEVFTVRFWGAVLACCFKLKLSGTATMARKLPLSPFEA